jgi:hypothetical protein
MKVHRQILVAHSRFFSVKLADCDDVEVYVATLRLMYCDNVLPYLRKFWIWDILIDFK